MSKSPWKPFRPSSRGIDWPMTVLIGGIVIASAVVVGLMASSLLFQ